MVIRVSVLSLSLVLASCNGDDTPNHRCPPPPEVRVCNLTEFARTHGVDVTNIAFEPGDVLYRHAAQLNMLALAGAEEGYRRANPNCPYPGARLVQTSDTPPCPRRADFTDRQMAGLRAAQGINQGAPRWWEALPDCPCNENQIPPGWTGGAANQTYHPGAQNCYRSPALTEDEVVAAGLDARLRPGQQCCYDPNGNLITSGAGAGTPDIG